MFSRKFSHHLSASSFICGRGHTLPSIEKTPSVTINLELTRSMYYLPARSQQCQTDLSGLWLRLIVLDKGSVTEPRMTSCCKLPKIIILIFLFRVLFGPWPLFVLIKCFVWTLTARPAIPVNPSPSPPCPCACTWRAVIFKTSLTNLQQRKSLTWKPSN